MTVPLNARNSENLATPNGEGDAIDHELASVVEHTEPLNLQQRFGRTRRRTAHRELHLTTDHHLGKLCGGCLLRCGFTGHSATSKDGNLVGNGDDLVQLVGDEDDRGATLR